MKDHTIPLPTLRYALFTTLICYLPYATIAPWWLLLFIVIALVFKLISAYYGFARLPKSILFVLIPSLLILLKIHYGTIISSTFYIGFLLTFIGLKITELYTDRDLKVLIFFNFYVIFANLILIQELWIITYLVIAVFANLSLMLKITAPQASLRQIGGSSIKQVLIAIPLSIVLFYIVPRLAVPLWQVPSQTQTRIGFNGTMNPGSIAQLFHDESTAFRVTFKAQPILNGYWRGVLLNFYNGISWNSVLYGKDNFHPLPPLTANVQPDYELLLEPHQQQWLFYIDTPTASNPKLLFSPSSGLVNEKKTLITQRFSYAIQSKKIPSPAISNQERHEIYSSLGVLIQNSLLGRNSTIIS